MNDITVPETYISIDIECDGPIPGVNSMLSFGAVAISLEKQILCQFERNLTRLPGGIEHPETRVFWSRNQEAFDATRKNMVAPKKAMMEFHAWLSKIKSKYPNPIWVGYPVGFDFMWIHWYLMKYVGDNIIGWSSFDTKTAAAVEAKMPYTMATKANLPRRWKHTLPHTQIAIEDALEQGDITLNIIREVYGLTPIEGLVKD